MSPSASQQRKHLQTVLPHKALGHRVASKLPTLFGFTSPSGSKEERRSKPQCGERFIHNERESEDPATPDMSPSSILDAALDKSQSLLDELLALNLHDDKSRMRAHISCASFPNVKEVSSEQPSACVPPPMQMPLQVPDITLLIDTEMLADSGKKHQNDEDSLSTCSTEDLSSSILSSPPCSFSPDSAVNSLDSSTLSNCSSASSTWTWPTEKTDPAPKSSFTSRRRTSTASRAANAAGVANAPPRPVHASKYTSTGRSPIHKAMPVASSSQKFASTRRMALRSPPVIPFR